MITLENLNEYGLQYVLMAINDLVAESGVDTYQHGMLIGRTWLTPETCYWLYKLLSSKRGSAIVSDAALSKLRNGTNHPESLI